MNVSICDIEPAVRYTLRFYNLQKTNICVKIVEDERVG
jgi:hypothetical protein